MTKKIVIIGVDSFSYRWLKPLFSRDYLLNLKRLIDEGSMVLLRAPITGATPHNWATISTGTVYTYHGCAWIVRAPRIREELYGFSSTTLMAEPIWAAASKSGIKCILLDIPQSYPVLYENIIHVGEDGRPDNSFRCIQYSKGYVSEDIYNKYMSRAEFTADPLPQYYKGMAKAHLEKIIVRKAENWRDVRCKDLYEAEISITTPKGELIDKLHLLIKSKERKVELYHEKSSSAKLGESRLKSWSKWILHEFRIRNKMCNAYFRFKLLRLSEDGKGVHVYFSQIYPANNFTYPEELSKELVKVCGPYLQTPTRQQVALCGACDVYTFIEELEYLGEWYVNAMKYLLKTKEWNLFYIKLHSSDFLNHLCAYMIDNRHPLFDPDRMEEGIALWNRALKPINKMIEVALSEIGDDGIIAVVSDHGSKLMHPYYIFSTVTAGEVIINALAKGGLVVKDEKCKVDWSESKVRLGTFGYLISVKGRDPNGIVDPEKYEDIRIKLIEVLRELRNPITGGHLFKLVCRREDAEALGFGGSRAADVFVWPNYGDDAEITYDKITMRDYAKMGIDSIGTWEWPAIIPSGAHDPIAMFIIKGRGVKEGYKSARVYPLTSVTPTICYAAGIPIPKNCTGSVIWEVIQ